MRAQLIATDGGETIEVVKDITLIGRKEDCDLRLDHKAVSKLHCVLVKTDGLLLLRDLGSTNGTKVNGQRVRRAALLPNDTLGVGHFSYRIHLGPGGSPSESHAENTLALDPDELAQLMEKAGTASGGVGEPSRTPATASEIEVHVNALPDVYQSRDG